MMYLEQVNVYIEKVEYTLSEPGAWEGGKKGSYCFMGTEFQFGKMKKF